MKRILVLLLCCTAVGCYKRQSTSFNATKKTDQLMAEAYRQIGMPNVKNFQQRKTLKMIIEQCDREDLVCYAYMVAKYSGKLIYLGRCLGYGVPFSAQYTNPERVVPVSERAATIRGVVTLPQADPSGLYVPTSSSATWLLLVDPETNEPRPVYIEPEIIVSPFKLDVQEQ